MEYAPQEVSVYLHMENMNLEIPMVNLILFRTYTLHICNLFHLQRLQPLKLRLLHKVFFISYKTITIPSIANPHLRTFKTRLHIIKTKATNNSKPISIKILVFKYYSSYFKTWNKYFHILLQFLPALSKLKMHFVQETFRELPN